MAEFLAALPVDPATMLKAFGVIGFAAYMAGYALLQTGRIDGDGQAYRWLNLVGASFMLISLYQDFNLGAALIQVSWIAISVLGFWRFWRMARVGAARGA